MFISIFIIFVFSFSKIMIFLLIMINITVCQVVCQVLYISHLTFTTTLSLTVKKKETKSRLRITSSRYLVLKACIEQPIWLPPLCYISPWRVLSLKRISGKRRKIYPYAYICICILTQNYLNWIKKLSTAYVDKLPHTPSYLVL